MVRRLLYVDLCIEEYEAKMNHKENELWDIWGNVYDELNDIFSGR